MSHLWHAACRLFMSSGYNITELAPMTKLQSRGQFIKNTVMSMHSLCSVYAVIKYLQFRIH